MESQVSAVNKYHMSQRVLKRAGLKETGHQTFNDHVAAAVVKQLTGRLRLCTSAVVTDLSAASFF